MALPCAVAAAALPGWPDAGEVDSNLKPQPEEVDSQFHLLVLLDDYNHNTIPKHTF